jgi:hypothetical protein
LREDTWCMYERIHGVCMYARIHGVFERGYMVYV